MNKKTKIITILSLIIMVMGIGGIILLAKNNSANNKSVQSKQTETKKDLDGSTMKSIVLGSKIKDTDITVGEVCSNENLDSLSYSKTDDQYVISMSYDDNKYVLHYSFSTKNGETTCYLETMTCNDEEITSDKERANELLYLKDLTNDEYSGADNAPDDEYYAELEEDNNTSDLDEVCSQLQKELNNNNINCTVTHPLDINNNQTITIAIKSSLSKKSVDQYRNLVDHATYMTYRNQIIKNIKLNFPISDINKINSDIKENLNANLVIKILYSDSQFSYAIYNNGWAFILPS